MQIVEVDAHSGSGAARRAAAHFVHIGEERIIEHALLAPEFHSVPHHRHFAFEFVYREVDSFAFERTERAFNAILRDPLLQVVETDSLWFKKLQARAIGILENALLDKVQKV